MGPLDAIDAREPYLPPEDMRFPMIDYSTGASWQSIATEYGKIVDSRASSPAVESVVAPLIAGRKSAADKEAAILDFLDREVRYTGMNSAKPRSFLTIPQKPWPRNTATAKTRPRCWWPCCAPRGYRRMSHCSM